MNKGYTVDDILEQCHRLEEAGIMYWMTFLNGAGGRSHSPEHALNSAKIFNMCNPVHVTVSGLTLFPGSVLRARKPGLHRRHARIEADVVMNLPKRSSSPTSDGRGR